MLRRMDNGNMNDLLSGMPCGSVGLAWSYSFSE